MDLVKDAIKEELNYFNSRVWAIADAQKILKKADSKISRTRWVICNKADAQNPDIRARLVACEINTFNTDDFLREHATLEAKRMILSHFATQCTLPDGRPLEVSFVDIKKGLF